MRLLGRTLGVTLLASVAFAAGCTNSGGDDDTSTSGSSGGSTSSSNGNASTSGGASSSGGVASSMGGSSSGVVVSSSAGTGSSALTSSSSAVPESSSAAPGSSAGNASSDTGVSSSTAGTSSSAGTGSSVGTNSSDTGTGSSAAGTSSSNVGPGSSSTGTASSDVGPGSSSTGTASSTGNASSQAGGSSSAMGNTSSGMVRDPALTSAEIAAIRSLAPPDNGASANLDLNPPMDITLAVVTALKPQVGTGNDVPGFTLQAQAQGPAILVMEAGTQQTMPAVGDRVSMRVTRIQTNRGQIRITAFTNYVVTPGVAANAEALVQDLSGNAGLGMPNAVTVFESELIALDGTIASDFTASGSSFNGANFTTAALSTPPTTARVRFLNGLTAEKGLVNGCSFALRGTPLWRFDAEAQPIAWRSSELSVTGCPTTQLTAANAQGATTVTLQFSNHIAAASITDAATQFTVMGPGGAMALVSAAVVGTTNSRVVTLTTAPLMMATTYTVSVASTVRDVRNQSVGANTAMFTTPNPSARSLVISQLYSAGNNTGATLNTDYVELHNNTNGVIQLTGKSLQYASGTGLSYSNAAANFLALSGVVQPGGYFLVKLAGGATNGVAPTAAPDQTGMIAMGASSGKVVLVDGTATLTGDNDGCPQSMQGAMVLDFVGYGAASCGEGGVGITAPAPSTTLILQRRGSGCTDTNNNAMDFETVTAAAGVPRNSATTAFQCP